MLCIPPYRYQHHYIVTINGHLGWRKWTLHLSWYKWCDLCMYLCLLGNQLKQRKYIIYGVCVIQRHDAHKINIIMVFTGCLCYYMGWFVSVSFLYLPYLIFYCGSRNGHVWKIDYVRVKHSKNNNKKMKWKVFSLYNLRKNTRMKIARMTKQEVVLKI